MKKYQNMKKPLKALYFVENIFCSFAMVVLLFSVFSVTVLRYIFNTSIVGFEEATLTIALYCYFIGAAVASRDGEQIKVNIIDEILERSHFKWVFPLMRSALTIIISIIFLYVSIDYGSFVLEKKLTISPLGISKFVAVASMIIGFLLIAFHETHKLVFFLRSEWAKNKGQKSHLTKKGESIDNE